MKLSSSRLRDFTPAKIVCLSIIAVSCLIIGVRIISRGHL